MAKRHYKTIIFDFDGTIADSLHLITEIYNSLAERHAFSPITRDDLTYLRSLGPKQALDYLAIPYYKLPFYLLQGRSLYKKYIRSLRPIVGIKDVIQAVSRQYRLGILTSNDKSIVNSFLAEQKLEVFDWVICERNLFGKHHSLRKIMSRHSLGNEDVLYIGDEVRDVESCQKIDVDVAAVTWGFNNETVLSTHNPTYLVRVPEDLYQILKVI